MKFKIQSCACRAGAGGWEAPGGVSGFICIFILLPLGAPCEVLCHRSYEK